MKTFARAVPPIGTPNLHAYWHLDRSIEVHFPEVGVVHVDVSIRLGDVLLKGWVRAKTSAAGLSMGQELAGRLGLKCIGLWGPDFSNAPFECEVRPGITDRRRGWRTETIEEAHDRVMTQLRRRVEIPAAA